MSAREWCEYEELYVNDDNSMMASTRTASSRPRLQDSRQEINIPRGGEWLRRVHWCVQYSVIPDKRHDIMRKALPRLKEMEEYFMPGSFSVKSQVTMGSCLVDLSGDSGCDGASRCRTTVGLDEHRTMVRGTLRKTMFRSSCSQTP